MKARHGRGDFDRGEMVLSNKVVQGSRKSMDFFECGLFSLECDGEFGEVSEGREELVSAFFNEIFVKA